MSTTLPVEQLDEQERAVLRVLPHGRKNAVRVRELAARADIAPRRFQELVEHLVHGHGILIGTSMGEPHGNYLIDDMDELRATEQLLRRRALSLLARAARLGRVGMRQYLASVQTELGAE
jgi:hypothetical protein